MKYFKLSVLSCYLILSPVALWLVVYSFFPHPLFARAYFLMTQCNSFEVAEKLALEDFASGKRQIIIGGFSNSTDIKVIRDSILLAEYKIEVLYAGCVGPTDEAWRYSETMLKEVAKIYGKDFADVAQARAVAIFKKRCRN